MDFGGVHGAHVTCTGCVAPAIGIRTESIDYTTFLVGGGEHRNLEVRIDFVDFVHVVFDFAEVLSSNEVPADFIVDDKLR